MNGLEKIYYDLTGTPYFKIQLMSHNHIMDILSFKPDEKIITNYGLFKQPEDIHKIYYKNNYYVTYDITDFKPLKLVKKPLVDKVVERIRFNDIIIEYEQSDDKNKQMNTEPCVYIADKITPQEFMALQEQESLIGVSKPKKESGGAFSTKNIMLILGVLLALFIAYNYITKGRIF